MNSFTELTEKAQAEIADAFYTSAQSNAATSNGLLVAYEPNFDRFPYQSLSFRRDRRFVEGHPLGQKKTFEVAEFVDKRCKGLESAIISADIESGAVESIHNILDSGQDVVVGMDHLEIVDLAFLAAGASAVLRSRGANHKSGMILSKAASDYMGVDLKLFESELMPFKVISDYVEGLGIEVLEDGTVPVRNFLKLAVDYQFLVIPNTGSFAELRGLQEEAVTIHNSEVKKDIKGKMTRRSVKRNPPLALYIAKPGTKNKPLDLNAYWTNMQIPGYHETIPEHLRTDVESVGVVGKISEGVIDYSKLGLTFPATVRLRNGEQPLVKFDSRPINIKDTDRLRLFAERLIQLTDSIDGTTSLYDIKGNLPILTENI